MKKEYKKPSTEFVVVRCNEKLMWGELADPSVTNDHGDAKKQGFFEGDEDEVAPTDKSVWDDESRWD